MKSLIIDLIIHLAGTVLLLIGIACKPAIEIEVQIFVWTIAFAGILSSAAVALKLVRKINERN